MSDMAKKEDIDEKLIRWNEIFDELTLDAKDLIKDIKDMINYVAFCAMLMVMMGVAAVLIAVLRQLEPKYSGGERHHLQHNGRQRFSAHQEVAKTTHPIR